MYLFAYSAWNQGKIKEAFIAILGFLYSIMWMHKLSEQIIYLIIQLSQATHIETTIIGLVCLAVVNSISDIAGNISVAKRGLGIVSLSACYGSAILSKS